ncbi:hypothetical protein BIV60_17070 [Bacillus sp. MUM 116]|uniref:hypothetical protein n=1 Tax=Bacillus sp. MUM 116 TaxID=1678002 RepID=UPI0008F5A573|nr:hypothetical protein [Bacillus sp. MUM 116]OIK11966.1 hypothetical protein BIV60_17070 [Bacillus sp. MUM 116]
MKKLAVFLSIIFMVGLMAACGGETASKPKEEPKKNLEASTNQKKEKEAVVKQQKPQNIDTSVFEFAKDVEVTNAIDTNQHLTVFVTMNNVSPGLATQHVVNQTYDFLQQKDIKGAKTITINVKQGGKKIAMFTVDKNKFKPNDNESMSDCVMKASKMEFMTPEVKEYGSTMKSW